MTFKAGKLRHRIVFLDKQQTQDPQGAMEVEWVERGSKVWASVEPLSARDFVAASAAQSKVEARIVVRFRDDVAYGMRVRYRGKTYKIEGVLPDPDSGFEYLTLPVSEVVDT